MPSFAHLSEAPCQLQLQVLGHARVHAQVQGLQAS
jgi:hypothetical protein